MCYCKCYNHARDDLIKQVNELFVNCVAYKLAEYDIKCKFKWPIKFPREQR